MLMYENIICFVSFACMDRMRERCTHRGEKQIFSELLLLHSTFMRHVLGHLKTLNHLSFSPLLYFHESGIQPSQSTKSSHFLTFASFVQLRLFSVSQPWAIWCKASAQSDVMSSSSFVGLRHSFRVKIFPA